MDIRSSNKWNHLRNLILNYVDSSTRTNNRYIKDQHYDTVDLWVEIPVTSVGKINNDTNHVPWLLKMKSLSSMV